MAPGGPAVAKAGPRVERALEVGSVEFVVREGAFREQHVPLFRSREQGTCHRGDGSTGFGRDGVAGGGSVHQHSGLRHRHGVGVRICHPGRHATFAAINQRFFSLQQSQMIRQFVKACDLCGNATVRRQKKHGLLEPLPIPSRIWRDISLDFIQDLPLSEGCKNLLVIRDRFGKGILLAGAQDMSAEATGDLSIRLFYRHHGLPYSIVSDRGRQ